jgi:hypothetical protein
MANHLNPGIGTAYATLIAEFHARIDDAVKGLDPAVATVTNMPVDTIRWSSAAGKWQKWNGTVWNDLAATYAVSISGNAATAAALQTARTINGISFNGTANITIPANTASTLTFNNGGAGGASGTTFDGSVARTISYNSVGAPSTSGTNATGTWGISVSGNAGTVTNGVYTGANNVLTGFNQLLGQTNFTVTAGTNSVGNSGSNGGLNVVSKSDDGGTTMGAATVTFQRPGFYGLHMGMDTDNVLRIGGFSDGAGQYRMELGTATCILKGLTATGNVTLTPGTGGVQADIATGVTVTGNTKTVNIGTGGASGSTTIVNIGPTATGAISAITLNGAVYSKDLRGSRKDAVDQGGRIQLHRAVDDTMAWTLQSYGAAASTEFVLYSHHANVSSVRVDGTTSNMIVAGDVTAFSDERLKKDWGALPSNLLERLAAVKHGTYTRVDTGARQVGVSAQDMRHVLAESVLEGKDEAKTLSVAYGQAALAICVELAKEVVALRGALGRLVEVR